MAKKIHTFSFNFWQTLFSKEIIVDSHTRLLDENEWTFGYDDNDTNDPEHEKHQKLWENRAKKRILELVAATTKWSELEKEESDD